MIGFDAVIAGAARAAPGGSAHRDAPTKGSAIIILVLLIFLIPLILAVFIIKTVAVAQGAHQLEMMRSFYAAWSGLEYAHRKKKKEGVPLSALDGNYVIVPNGTTTLSHIGANKVIVEDTRTQVTEKVYTKVTATI